MDWNNLLHQYDICIRSGNSSEAILGLRQLYIKQIPRNFAWQFADLARRANLVDLGLRILKPYLLSETLKLVPTQDELIVYSALLIKIGAVEEALLRLKPLVQAYPRAAMYTAYAYISQWNYREATFFLEQISNTESLDSYQVGVVQVNLVACYINLAHWDKAEKLIKILRQKCELNNWTLLLANVSELSSLLVIETAKSIKELAFAQTQLDQTLTGLEKTVTAQQKLFLNKWKAILQLKQLGAQPDTLQALQKVRLQAEQLRHWETIRDCDFYEAVHTQNQSLAQHLLHGTPFTSFQKKVKQHFLTLNLASEIVWAPGHLPNKTNEYDLDLYSGTAKNNESVFKIPSVPYRLFTALTADFYRPQLRAHLFAKTYPGEFYNPVSTPARMQKSIQRLQTVLHKALPGLELKSANGGYWLWSEINKPCAILLKKDRFSKSKNSNSLTQQINKLLVLKNRWPFQCFSAKQAGELLQSSTRTLNTLLSWAVGENRLKTEGASRNTRYFFVSK